jgi:hypothetical protein
MTKLTALRWLEQDEIDAMVIEAERRGATEMRESIAASLDCTMRDACNDPLCLHRRIAEFARTVPLPERLR